MICRLPSHTSLWPFLVLILIAGCDEGLKPQGVVMNGQMSGLITFVHWDSAGSVEDIRVVAFRVFPPANVVEEVLQGRAVVYPPLGAGALVVPGVDSVRYVVTLPPGTYPYVVVAQQFGPDVLTDWRAVGQFDLDTNLVEPSPVVIRTGETTSDIDINVDFSRLPPPPP